MIGIGEDPKASITIPLILSWDETINGIKIKIIINFFINRILNCLNFFGLKNIRWVFNNTPKQLKIKLKILDYILKYQKLRVVDYKNCNVVLIYLQNC
tara:strand:- start:97 stop:390 length:294 start_codon:yes stop_codon:yes gene_type:complete